MLQTWARGSCGEKNSIRQRCWKCRVKQENYDSGVRKADGGTGQRGARIVVACALQRKKEATNVGDHRTALVHRVEAQKAVELEKANTVQCNSACVDDGIEALSDSTAQGLIARLTKPAQRWPRPTSQCS